MSTSRSNADSERGFTLIELMIGMLVGSVVLAGALTVFVSVLANQRDHNQIVRLSQDMRTIADLMVRDIRRAGFATDNPASNAVSLLDNPFFRDTGASTSDLSVVSGSNITRINGSGNCILYSYNRNYQNEVPPVLTNDERFGFKLDSGDLFIRVSGATNSESGSVLTDDPCGTGGEWYVMNSPSIEFTGLTFTVSSAQYNVTSTSKSSCVNNDSCLIVRTVTIDMTARVEDEPSIEQNITKTVRVRNDKFVASYASGSIY